MALTAAIPLIFGGIVYGLLHDDIGWKSTPPYWVWGLINCGIIFVLLYFGVRISTRAQLTLSLVSASVVLAFMIYIIAKGGAGGDSNSIKPFLPSSSADGWSGIFYGILYITAVGVGAAVSTSRGIFAMARDRRVPGALAKVSPRYGTPSGSILFTVGLCAAIVLWTRLGHGVLTREIPGVPPDVAVFPEYFPMFSWLAGYGSFALAAVYATVALAGIRSLWDAENRGALVIAGVIGCVVALGGLWGAIYKVVHPANKIPWAVLITLILGVFVGFIFRGRQMASQVIPELSEAE